MPRSRTFVCVCILFLFFLHISLVYSHQSVSKASDGAYDVAIIADLADQTAELPDYWKASNKIANGHIYPPNFMPPLTELQQFGNDINGKAGNASFLINLDLVYLGGLPITPNSRLINVIRDWRNRGGRVFITITDIPSPLWYDQSGQYCYERNCGSDDPPYSPDCRRYRPSDFEAYQALLEDLVKYLTLPPELGVTIENDMLGLDQPYETHGFDDIYFIFWQETNISRYSDIWCRTAWTDDYAQWLRLYDYWVAAVRAVRSEYPDDVNFKIGTKWFTGNMGAPDPPGDEQVGKALYDADTFIQFLLGNPRSKSCFEQEGNPDDPYEYRNQDPPPSPAHPLDLDFMTRQKRTDDHQLLSNDGIGPWVDLETPDNFDSCGAQSHLEPHDTDRGFDSNFYLKFEHNGLHNLEWFSWDVKNDVAGTVQDFILSFTTPYERGESTYVGVQSDNQMGAVNYLAQVWDHFENPDQLTFTDPDVPDAPNDMVGLWAEFWSDPRGYPASMSASYYPVHWPDHDDDGNTGSYDYGFYKAGEGMLFTNSGGLNLYEETDQYPVSIKKPFYNVVEMIGKLQSRQLPVTYSFGTGLPNELDKKDMIRGIVTKSATDETIAILWWYYLNPQDVSGEIESWNYQDIMDHVETSETKDVVIELTNVPLPSYELHQYVVDDISSNGWTYRDCIYCYYRSGDECNENDPHSVEEAQVHENRVVDINNWRMGDGNPCNASVALEVETGVVGRRPNGNLILRYRDVKPWTAMLVLLQTGYNQ